MLNCVGLFILNGMSPKPRKLSLKQKRFADAYIESGNGTKSVLNAYDANPNTARVMAVENLAKPIISEYIAKKLALEDAKPTLVIQTLLNKISHPDPVISLKAAELLGKHLRMFSDKAADPLEVLEKVKGIGWGRIKSSEEHDKPIETHSETNKKVP